MTVKDLIEKLSEFPPDLTVVWPDKGVYKPIDTVVMVPEEHAVAVFASFEE